MYFKNKTHKKSTTSGKKKTKPQNKTKNQQQKRLYSTNTAGKLLEEDSQSRSQGLPPCQQDRVGDIPSSPRAPLRALCPVVGSGEPSLPLSSVAAPSWPTQTLTWCGFQPCSKESYRAALKRRWGGEKSVRNCRKGRENICLEAGGGNKASFLQVCSASIKVFKHSHTE